MIDTFQAKQMRHGSMLYPTALRMLPKMKAKYFWRAWGIKFMLTSSPIRPKVWDHHGSFQVMVPATALCSSGSVLSTQKSTLKKSYFKFYFKSWSWGLLYIFTNLQLLNLCMIFEVLGKFLLQLMAMITSHERNQAGNVRTMSFFPTGAHMEVIHLERKNTSGLRGLVTYLVQNRCSVSFEHITVVT